MISLDHSTKQNMSIRHILPDSGTRTHHAPLARARSILRAMLLWLLAFGLFDLFGPGIQAQTKPDSGGTIASRNTGPTKPPGKPNAGGPFGYTPDISELGLLVATDYQARFDSQSVPGSVVAGRAFSATVIYTNTGNLTWSAATNFKLGSQNPRIILSGALVGSMSAVRLA
jgi:hypothetical protein